MYCKTHCGSGAISCDKRSCQEVGCEKNGPFRRNGDERRFCRDHVGENIDSSRGGLCHETGCGRYGLFYREGDTRRFCERHAGESEKVDNSDLWGLNEDAFPEDDLGILTESQD